MVEAARKYNRIVQAGTPHRSCPAGELIFTESNDTMYVFGHCELLT